MVVLHHLLTGSDGDHYRSSVKGTRFGNVGAIVHCPEAIQDLLRTYVTEQATTKTVDDSDDFHWTENENEAAQGARLNNAAYSYGKFHKENNKI